ncbi:MAG: hypothetical protein JXO49_02745 [Deltaproteobacteria bacterium]|nr:hypothetical protein [Candidatus Anaeroferrophillus wilburensis]MBN2888247.1 hypothetical protein [Deltaproteobacteria bacterium]
MKKILLLAVCWLLVLPGSIAAQQQLSNTMIIARGSALLAADQTAARREAINDALGNALHSYVYDQLLANHSDDELINEHIFNRQDRYILSYEIISDRLLGDLFQIELAVHVNQELVQEELAMIMEPEKRAVQDIRLIIIQRYGTAPLSTVPLLEQSLPLEPSSLAENLHGELAAYGFMLTYHPNISDELQQLFLLTTENRRTPDNSLPVSAGRFKELLPGDLAIFIDLQPMEEKHIGTVDKLLLSVDYDMTFVDMKNNSLVILPPAATQVLAESLPAGMPLLAEKLNAQLKNQIMDRMLREYAVFPENEQEIMLAINGFRQHRDFKQFTDELETLRTVGAVRLHALSAGHIELKVSTYATMELLIEWLNRFSPADGSYALRSQLLPSSVDTVLVQVDYAVHPDQ